MPTPIAHSSIWLIARHSPVARAFWNRAPRTQRWTFVFLSLGLLCWPDCDFVLRRLSEYPPLGHGGLTHSLVAAVTAAAVWAGLCSALFRRHELKWGGLFLFGLMLSVSHPLMDIFTRGGGVMLLWPFSLEEISGPAFFYGARHSAALNDHRHFITLFTELAFVLGIWLVSCAIKRRSERLESNASQSK